ncbi:hypothetical protein KQCUZIGB_CDS0063 [Pectobacterium phage Ymer]|uniref:Phage protein n=1 Tax=Pectobacterium phage Koroua TaxID=3158138 RepID=A0AB39ABS2_9CAUD|nr:hypothetical protein Ymer_46 [Pectobacterium phage Ymer]
MSNKIKPIPVVRDEDGYFCHPVYLAMYGDREYVPHDEYERWLQDNGVESKLVIFENDADDDLREEYFDRGQINISKWEPTPPDGDGWFIVDICDTEEVPICVFLRSVDHE